MRFRRQFANMATFGPRVVWRRENAIDTQLTSNDTCYQVLVVDDLQDVRLVLSRLLQLLGHKVKSVGSAAQALATLNAYRPDVIISDISMPEMDGYEFVRTLRRQPDTRLLYVVAMTGNELVSSRQASLDAGFDAHLTKPFKLETIQQLLAQPQRRIDNDE